MADKHIIIAKDKETGEQRHFIFEGDLGGQTLIVEEVFRPMTKGEAEIAKGLDESI